MRIFLKDINLELVEAWRDAFATKQVIPITALQTDIFDLLNDDPMSVINVLVSPANSFGFMTGGIDGVYSRRFGLELQDRVQTEIKRQYFGELPVGCALTVPTGNNNFPLMIIAPTMRLPMDVSQTVNAYLAFRAAIHEAMVIERQGVAGGPEVVVHCPGLGSATGNLSPRACARQMFEAIETLTTHPFEPNSLLDVSIQNRYLIQGETPCT